MKRTVTVIDYGIGNLFSVVRAFEVCGAEVRVTDRPEHVEGADRLVLPGVGAFKDGISELRKREMSESILSFSNNERPFLGICLGMQMMFDSSEEFGHQEGLGLISGKVTAIPKTTSDGHSHKIPHIGWNGIVLPESRESWEGGILTGTLEQSAVYFVHSYTCVPDHDKYRLADSYYNGRLISAAVQKDYLFGVQFHPEKSGEIGLQIIRNFVEM